MLRGSFGLATSASTLALLFASCSSTATPDSAHEAVSGGDSELCTGFGPQTPRDIDSKAGTNMKMFAMAPESTSMNLCNIHFHKNAEHRAADFSIPARDGAAGFQCNASATLTDAERAPFDGPTCKDIAPGDTVEVHWVHSSCDISPGPGLGSCLNDACTAPLLRVETQVFTVVNDRSALNFEDFRYKGASGSLHQPAALPTGTGTPVLFRGSTTGPSYTQAKCSPLEVTWSVRPQCAKVDIASLGKWCSENVFNEDHGHGVRKLVTAPSLLSPIGM